VTFDPNLTFEVKLEDYFLLFQYFAGDELVGLVVGPQQTHLVKLVLSTLK